MGLKSTVIGYIQTLFGHARTRVAINGEVTPTFNLHRSIRQGCPLAPLLYAIASDGLSCLVEKKLANGEMKGIEISDQEQICNALIKNKEQYLSCFWDCLKTSCLASGSVIEHKKTGVKTMSKAAPQWLLNQGCEEIEEGKVFRLLGILMGFGISLKQRWDWALAQIKRKVERWKNGMFSMAGRILIINKFIIPTVIYFLACWRPPESSLKQLSALCRNFLWSGSCTDFKIPKVKWEICILQKDKGGLRILNPLELANRLASKWIVRSLQKPDETWAKLLYRHISTPNGKASPT